MVCGGEAHDVVSKKLSWSPGWVWILLFFGLLPFLIVALITTKRALLVAPMCPAHKGHWTKRTVALLLSFFALIGLLVFVIQADGKPWQTALIFGFIFSLIAWVIVAIGLSMTAIRPRSITDSEIILVNVSSRFIDALVDFDPYEPEERPRRRRPLRDREPNPHIQEERHESSASRRDTDPERPSTPRHGPSSENIQE
jgi:hypothetical protein